MAADNGKKQKLGEVEDDINGLDGELVLSIEKLQEIQDELEKVNEEASEKVLEVEHQYNVIRKPVYDKRNEIIKAIPEFWLTAFVSHPALGELLTFEDQKIFKYLSNLEVDDSKDVKSGYSVKFTFQPNPYFEDSVLVKTITFNEDEGTTSITSTPIKWKEGMGIPNGIAEESKGNKRSHEEESFFTWFSDSKNDIDELHHEQIAEIIKEELWPNPLSYFNNEVDEEDVEEDEDNEDEGSEEDDDDADDDDDSEE